MPVPRPRARLLLVPLLAALAAGCAHEAGARAPAPAPSAGPTAAAAAAGPAPLRLTACQVPGVEEALRCGTHSVPENRQVPGGRRLPLKVVVIPARAPLPGAEPLYFFSGGPGQAATESAADMASGWERQDRDVVLVDVRGTGEGHRLDCAFDTGADLQQDLQPLFSEKEKFRACREELERRADLTQYTTPNAMQDVDEVRQALGHARIHVYGISYGTRSALLYMRMFPQHVRTALLSGLVPQAFRSPLFHAEAAQRALDGTVRECEAEPACRAAYPTLREDVPALLARLRAAPAKVTVPHPDTGVPTELVLTEPAFTDGLRVMLYSAERGRAVPRLLQEARKGDFAPFALAALTSSRGMRQSIRLGLMLSFTCTEDTARIRPEEVAPRAAGSFIGDFRVRGQMAACEEWARTSLPEGYFAPFASDVPTLLVSGNLDPVTPPRWGEDAARHLPNSVHVVNPGGHGAYLECLNRLGAELFRTGSAKGLDTSCVAGLRNPPFVLPGQPLPSPGG
jgi:pimeloyl-ACP methyl ester carboxylesterase